MTTKIADTTNHLEWLIANQEAYVDRLPDGRGKERAAARLTALRRELAAIEPAQ